MNLGDSKKITLGLIEEFSPNNPFLTEDEDIRDRLNLVYAPNYQYLARIKKILKTKIITVENASDDVLVSTLPQDMYQFKRLVALDGDNNRISPDYDIIGNKLYLRQKAGKYIIEYYAYPTDITLETKDNFELEIDRDVQADLPYLVANDILKVDPSADYTAFYAEYQRRIDNLDTRTALSSAEVTEGYI